MHATEPQLSRPGGDAPAAFTAALGSTGQLLRLAVGRSMFAVPIDLVREILKVGQMTTLPLMPSFVRGVMNLRGAVVPVIDLGARLTGEPSSPSRRTCVVVVEIRNRGDGPTQVMGVMVDAVHEVVNATDAQIEPVPSLGTAIRADFLAAMARLRKELVPVLALEQILDEAALTQAIAAHIDPQPTHSARMH
jgi:purine-binding chemotaxis protein CheW